MDASKFASCALFTVKPNPGGSIPDAELHLGIGAPCYRLTGCLTKMALVPHNRLMSQTAHHPNEQLCNFPRQAAIERNPNHIGRSTLRLCFVDLNLGDARICPALRFLASLLRPLELRQQELRPAFSAANFVRPQFCFRIVSSTTE